MEEIRLGTIGSGAIVRSILDNVVLTEGIRLEAVYSRTLEKGSSLAQRYGVSKVYTELSDLFADEAVNCIYVASPNMLHYPHAKAALLAGKHVICEKPFSTKGAQAQELVALAKEKGLMLIDATPTAYLPNLSVLREQLPKIGRIRLVMTNYSQYSSRYDQLLRDEVTNVFNPAFGGGCLMDINYYNLYLNILLFGKPQKAIYYPNQWKNGIDTSGCIVMQYPDFVSTNTGAKDTWGVNFVQIEGEKGYIYIKGSNGLEEIRVVAKTTEEVYNLQDNPDRWYYEVQEVASLLLREDRKTIEKNLAVMTQVMDVLEKIRVAAGVRFPSDEMVGL